MAGQRESDVRTSHAFGTISLEILNIVSAADIFLRSRDGYAYRKIPDFIPV